MLCWSMWYGRKFIQNIEQNTKLELKIISYKKLLDIF